MDSHRFDTVVQQLYVLRTRREGLRILLASLVAGGSGMTDPDEASGAKKTKRRRRRRETEICRGKGELCEPRCCSGRCVEVGGEGAGLQAEKKKKKEKGCKRKGGRCCRGGCQNDEGPPRRCDCSKIRELCPDADDCCLDDANCGGNNCDEDRRCCRPPGASCLNSCECCGPNGCDFLAGGRCTGACIANGQPCATSESCCDFPSDGCSSIGNSCGDENVCCTRSGSACDVDCDCCLPDKCQDGVCKCSALQQTCKSDEECCLGAVCGFDNADGGQSQVCCLPEGSPCNSASDCCFEQLCKNVLVEGFVEKQCAGPENACLPEEMLCPPGFFEPCCPPGTTCASFGCVTDEPDACPAGADTCARPLVFCGGPPLRPQDCACFLDLAGNAFCSLSVSCTRECATNADCEDERFPGSRCVRCPTICGHNGGVCSSAACPV